MANHRNRFPGRRRFLKQSTALTAGVVALPRLARATEQDAPVDPARGQVGETEQGTGDNADVNGQRRAPDAGANAPQDPSRLHGTRRTRGLGR